MQLLPTSRQLTFFLIISDESAAKHEIFEDEDCKMIKDIINFVPFCFCF